MKRARRRLVAALAAWPITHVAHAWAAQPAPVQRVTSPLPVIGTAAPFELTDQDGATLALSALRGKVVALTFILTTCSSACPVLTAAMAGIRQRLGIDFGRKVHFVSATVDPLTDTPDQLRRYAARFGIEGAGWSFVTGDAARIDAVVAAYGAFVTRRDAGETDHAFLTSIIDRRGRLRVQYLGTRFNPDEMLADLRSLIRES
jgi:protein SCO1